MNTRRLLWGLFCAAMGGFIMLMAAGIVPTDDSQWHAPRWVGMLGGLIFVAGGWAIMFHDNRLLSGFAAFIIVSAMGTVAGWIALHGASEGFSGGIPFIPRHWNIMLARIMFGLGAAMSAFILFMVVRHYVGRSKR